MLFSKTKKILLFLILLGLLFGPTFYCLAADTTYGLNTAAKHAYGKNPGTLRTSPVEIVGLIVGVVLSLLGVIFLIEIVVAGISWMTAQGNEEKITKAKQNMVHSIIGLMIVLGAYAIVAFVFGGLMEAIIKK